jgi:thiol-disulfide isomerase/thioredoxin
MMRRLLYTGLLLAANAGFAGEVDPALLVGDMGKLAFVERPLPEATVLGPDDAAHGLGEFAGRWVVVNFWATWCAPCREEMPSLDRLQAAMPGLAVVAVAVGPNPAPAMERFLAEAGVASLTIWRDPETRLARLIGGAEWDAPEAMAVFAALAE